MGESTDKFFNLLASLEKTRLYQLAIDLYYLSGESLYFTGYVKISPAAYSGADATIKGFPPDLGRVATHLANWTKAAPTPPSSAIIANKPIEVQSDSESKLPTCYTDIVFTCRDCGSNELWSAEQQRFYYETSRRPLDEKRERCRKCRDRKIDYR